MPHGSTAFVYQKRSFLVQCADNLREEAALGRASAEELGKLLLLVKRGRVQRDSSYLLGCKVDVGLFAYVVRIRELLKRGRVLNRLEVYIEVARLNRLLFAAFVADIHSVACYLPLIHSRPASPSMIFVFQIESTPPRVRGLAETSAHHIRGGSKSWTI